MSIQYDIWTYRIETTDPGMGTDVVGYHVEALDGRIGKVDEASDEVGASSIVVDTGPWIFGKKVVLPAGVIDRVDSEEETVYVNRTKDQIKDAPQLDDGARWQTMPIATRWAATTAPAARAGTTTGATDRGVRNRLRRPRTSNAE